MDINEYADRLKSYRESLGLSIIELAEKASLYPQDIVVAESGLLPPKPEVAVKIAKALDVPVEQVLLPRSICLSTVKHPRSKCLCSECETFTNVLDTMNIKSSHILAKDAECVWGISERILFAMRQAGMGVWDWNIVENTVTYDTNYLKLIGMQPGAVESRTNTWISRIHPDDLEKTIDANLACIRNETSSFCVDFRMLTSDGEYRWIRGQGEAAQRDENGQAMRLIGTHTDIHEQKKKEQMSKSIQRIIRHDIKKPAIHALSIVNTLRDDEYSFQNKSLFLDSLEETANKMLDIVNLFITCDKLESGKVIFNESVEIRPLISRILNNIGMSSEYDVKRVNVIFADDFKGTVNGYAPLCETMIANLLINALEAPPVGDKVRVSIANDAKNIRLTIHNTGQVPESIQNSFFEKFSTAGKCNGTGLGTYLSRLIARELGGDVFMETREDGTVVTIELPLQKKQDS